MPSSSASLSRKSSSVKAQGKEELGEAATGSNGHGRHGVAVSNDMPAIAPRKIIGAVEDEWPLYRREAITCLSRSRQQAECLQFDCSCRPADYEIGQPVGFGAAAVVHLAKFCPIDVTPRPAPLTCAVKIIDVDRMPTDADIRRLRM